MPDHLKYSYEVIVIGAGPAGSSAARAAAQRGADVLLIDQKELPGIPVQCGELVSQWVFHYLPSFSNSVVQRVEKLVTHIHGGNSFEIKSPGWMIDRSLLDKELIISATLAGAKTSLATRAIDLSPEGITIDKSGKKELIRADIVIGADGVHSTVGRWTGQSPLKKIVALQYEVVLFNSESKANIFFHPDYEGGYAWFFPKGSRANVGIGVLPSKAKKLPKLLDQFLDHIKGLGILPRVEILSKTGGAIPCQLRPKTVFHNILLVGDAGGHAHPITGSGILNAIVGGEIAGKTVAEALENRNMNHLITYESEWREAFGNSLQYGFFKRIFLEKNWNKKGLDFQELIQKTWVGFKEYYKDRKSLLFSNEGEGI